MSWPLGDKDLEVIPLFHVVKCVLPYDGILANPIFYKSEVPGSIEAQASADFMYKKCTVLFFISEVRSKQCERTFKPDNLQSLGAEMHPLEINCDTVSNSGCSKSNEVRHPQPKCGFASNFAYKLLDEENIDWENPSANISINATFKSMLRDNQKPLYHVAFYGEASQYMTPQEVG